MSEPNLNSRIIPLWDSDSVHVPKKTGFDYEAFRAEFVRLKSRTSYQCVNETSAKRKAAAWLAYTPLAKERFVDDWLTEEEAPFVDRLRTIAGKVYRYRRITRFYELLATARAYGEPVLDCDFQFKRHLPTLVTRTCICCGRHKPMDGYDRDRRFPIGLAFYCKACREDVRRNIWRKDVWRKVA